MSDPVKSSEIEDVLASIRRLVSEEARSETQVRRQAAAEHMSAQPEPQDDAAADALMLTPALRVHEGGRSAEAPEAATADRAANTPAPTNDVPQALEEAETITAIESVPEPDPVPEPVDAASIKPDADADAETEEPEAVFAEEDLPEPPSETPTLETKIAALEALISGSSESRRKPAPETEVSAESEPSDTAVETPVEDLTQDHHHTFLWEDHLPETDKTSETTDTSAASEAPAEPVEAQPADAVHYESEDLAEAEPILADEDSDDESATAEDQTTVDKTASVTIDETMLRDMVTEIVREELQGALGERITRNVRRLVRREIHRAPANHDLE